MSNPLITCLPVVLFHHQGHRFAVEAQYISKQGQADDLEDEALISFSDLYPSSQSPLATSRHWLELFNQAGQVWRLGLQRPAELIELPVSCINPLPALLQARSQLPALQALALYQGAVVALLNVDALQQMAERASLDPLI